jgi:DNA-binding HxlR family transcriptional regulator
MMDVGTLSDGPHALQRALRRAIAGVSHCMLTLTLRGLEQTVRGSVWETERRSS